jgi:3-dehydroquinate synthetase
MQSFAVSFERTDEIRFLIDDDPALMWLREFDASAYQRIFVYVDGNVRKRWGGAIAPALEAHGKQVFWLDVPPEEQSKSLAFYPTALAFLEERGAGRFDLVVAIGGGIVLDLVSFVTSTYMRGLPFYAVPTTLVGQMDASTAGKTCLNTASAKNVLGTFYYPRVVYNNTCFLLTNTPYYLRQGFSEIFKYGLLRRPALVQALESHHAHPTAESLANLVRMSIETRVQIRQQDPLASNLGHTFGHAIEKLSGFRILHGDAISAGTVMALEYARRRGLMDEAAVRSIVERMRRVNLNVYFERGTEARDMVRLMLRDKKSSPDALYLVLIREMGVPYQSDNSFFFKADPRDVEAFLADYLATSEFAMTDCARFLERDQLYPALEPA